MMKPEPSPCTGRCCGAWPRKNGANGLLGPKGLAPLPPLPPSSSPWSSSPWEFHDAVVLLTTAMLTTADPYFCTMELKSGSIAAPGAVDVCDVGAAGAAASAVVAAARVAPAMYSAPTGAAIVAAPRTAAMSGFFTRLGRFMLNTPT